MGGERERNLHASACGCAHASASFNLLYNMIEYCEPDGRLLKIKCKNHQRTTTLFGTLSSRQSLSFSRSFAIPAVSVFMASRVRSLARDLATLTNPIPRLNGTGYGVLFASDLECSVRSPSVLKILGFLSVPIAGPSLNQIFLRPCAAVYTVGESSTSTPTRRAVRVCLRAAGRVQGGWVGPIHTEDRV